MGVISKVIYHRRIIARYERRPEFLVFEQSDAAKDIIEESLQDTKCRKRRQKGGKGLILLSTVSSLLWKLLHAVHVIYRNMYQRRKSV